MGHIAKRRLGRAAATSAPKLAAARLRVAASAEQADSDARKTSRRGNVGLFLVRAIAVYRSAAEALESDQRR